jgi:hypothetical protein
VLKTKSVSFSIPGFPVVSNDYNLDPFSFHLTFVELVLRLITKFDLNLLEIFSVVTCYEIFPHCLYYFEVAANTLLLEVKSKHTKKFRGVLLGFKIAQSMLEIFQTTRDVSSTSSTTLPSTRFRYYTSLVKITTLPMLSVWEEQCHHKLHTILIFNNNHLSTRNKPSIAYTFLINELIPKAPDCCELSFQHEIGICLCGYFPMPLSITMAYQ